MPRYALKIEYDGRPFHGWQRQPQLSSVQGTIEAALARLDSNVTTIGAAGRTDTGVHANGQVAHCDLTQSWDPFRLSEALNYHLKPNPVAILQVAPVADDWHARFSASERHYVFRLVVRRAPMTHHKGLFWHVHHAIQLEPMQKAANYLLGTHDFTTFRAAECQAKSPVKTLDHLSITQHPIPNGHEYRFHIRARSFLHNQVRSFVGSLERVGAGRWTPEHLKAALEARDRSACGPVCTPNGLYLDHVVYPNDPFVIA
jgi:tRNA pseudouridine38-40 synthase